MSEINKEKLATLIDAAYIAKYKYWDSLSDIEIYIGVQLDALGLTGDDVTELEADMLLKDLEDKHAKDDRRTAGAQS